MTNDEILMEVHQKFGEYIEMALHKKQASDLVIDILCTMVRKERDNNNYYKKVLKNVSVNTTN